MNESFTDPIFGHFSVERKRQMRAGVWKRKEKGLRERLVIQLQWSVNYLKIPYDFLKTLF